MRPWIWMHWHLRRQVLVGSDLANMINEAAITAVKNGRKCCQPDGSV